MLFSAVSANILPSLVCRHTRVYCIHVFKIMKTLSCSVARNNDLLTKEETIGQLIHTNEAYTVYAYLRICIRVYAYWADAYYAYILVQIYLSCTVVSLKTFLKSAQNQSLSSEIFSGRSHKIGILYQSFFSDTGLENSSRNSCQISRFVREFVPENPAKFDIFFHDLPEAQL